jgi:hypothetical protein
MRGATWIVEWTSIKWTKYSELHCGCMCVECEGVRTDLTTSLIIYTTICCKHTISGRTTYTISCYIRCIHQLRTVTFCAARSACLAVVRQCTLRCIRCMRYIPLHAVRQCISTSTSACQYIRLPCTGAYGYTTEIKILGTRPPCFRLSG